MSSAPGRSKAPTRTSTTRRPTPRAPSSASPTPTRSRCWCAPTAPTARARNALPRPSRSPAAPRSPTSAYRRLVRWYSDCQHPRVQLVDSFTVQRPAGDFQILLLRSQSTPVRTFTVGFSHSGNVTSTLVHEVDGADRSGDRGVRAHAQQLGVTAVRRHRRRLHRRDLGHANRATAHLDRPGIPRHRRSPAHRRDRPRMGRRQGVPGAKANPAATECDRADFSVDPDGQVQGVRDPAGQGAAQGVRRRRDDRPIPRARSSPRPSSRPSAARIDDCAAKKLSAEVDQRSSFKTAALLRQDLAHRPRGHQGQARILPGRDRATWRRRRPGDVHAVGQVRRAAEGRSTAVAVRAGARLRFVGQ